MSLRQNLDVDELVDDTAIEEMRADVKRMLTSSNQKVLKSKEMLARVAADRDEINRLFSQKREPIASNNRAHSATASTIVVGGVATNGKK